MIFQHLDYTKNDKKSNNLFEKQAQLIAPA